MSEQPGDAEANQISGAQSDVTLLLQAHQEGDAEALDRLIELVYEDLRRIARAQLRKQPWKRDLATTALVNEAYVRLVEGSGLIGSSRSHFLAVVARAMRFVLIDFARKKSSLKRGNTPEETLEDDMVGQFKETEVTTVLAIHEALERLQASAPRLVQVVECRYFAGLSLEETAEALDVSTRTVERDWRLARASLYHSLGTPSLE